MKRLDPTRSRIRIRTYAEGLFSRFAHDLELVCTGFDGSVDETRGTAEITIPIARIEVAGALLGDVVRSMSDRDKSECTAKMRREVFHDGELVRALATLEGGHQVNARLDFPNGRSLEQELDVEIDRTEAIRGRGKMRISLASIGSLPVKGPMNAFRLKDDVDVFFDIVFG